MHTTSIVPLKDKELFYWKPTLCIEQSYPLTVTWHVALWPGLPNYAQWRVTSLNSYTPQLSCCLHYLSVLAFGSKDKNSWHSSSQDLIVEAHFKARPYSPWCPCWQKPALVFTAACVFFSSLSWKERKTWIRSERGGEGKMLLFLPLIFLSKALRQCFLHYYYAKMFPKSVFSFLCVCVLSSYCFRLLGDTVY